MPTVERVRIEVWYDYICPWCYLALDRAQYLEEQGSIPERLEQSISIGEHRIRRILV